MAEKRTDKKFFVNHMWQAGLLLLLFLQVLLVLYYGGKKAGYHEDEYYSYYSTNRTAGLFVPDREWVDKETYRNEFVVQKGEQFRYGLVATVQSWDVHPPLYYFMLHTACSLFPDVFSKWQGIGVNLIAYMINFFLMAWLTYMVSEKNKTVTFLICTGYGWNAVIISGVMFIRMYEWLTLFVLLCACIHVQAMKKKEFRFHKFLLPLMFVNYLGFLTQYYYIIFLFFMAAGFCIWQLFFEKNLINCLRYGVSTAVSVGMAVISYPSSLSHIFRGYRGTGAASEFLDTGNTGERLHFFYQLMDDYLFDGCFLVLLAAMIAFAAVLVIREKKKKPACSKEYLLLLFAACGYFFTVSKTALLLYETSNRYQLPIYGIVFMLMLLGMYALLDRFFHAVIVNEKLRKVSIAALFVLVLAGDIHGLASGRVLFLYEEDAGRVAYAKENAHTPVVVLYNDATPYHVWWCSAELLEYGRVYFASEKNKEQITDDTICNSKRLIVYAADYETKEESLQMLLDSNPELESYRLIATKSLWSVYEFQ